MKKEWQFNGVMDCDNCKFWCVGIAGEDECPYIAGWKDGQEKLLNFEILLPPYSCHATF